MDQAALQWVSLEQSSGAPCWTAWGAREQQSLPTWLVRWRMRICDSITCPLYGWVETGLKVTADFCFAHSTALRVFQGRWRPGMYWTVLLPIRFFVGNEPCITRAILTKMKTVRLASWDEVTLLALWVCCLRVEPPCPLAHYTLHACWILRMVPWHLWFCPQRRLTASSARALVGCAHIYPYETWGTAHLFAMAVRIFYTWSADLPERHYRLPPLTGGVLGTSNHRDITTNRGWIPHCPLQTMTFWTSTSERTLREAI